MKGAKEPQMLRILSLTVLLVLLHQGLAEAPKKPVKKPKPPACLVSRWSWCA